MSIFVNNNDIIGNSTYYIKNYVEQQIYPFTVKHILYFIIVTAVTYYITEYFIRFKLLKWIYFGTLIVIGANMLNQGH